MKFVATTKSVCISQKREKVIYDVYKLLIGKGETC